MKRKFKVIVNISINIHNINNNLPVQIIEHKKTMTFADGNPGPDLRKVQKHIHLIIFTKLFCHYKMIFI